MKIRNATMDDAARIANIYNYYIANTVITFEEEKVSTEQMARRVETTLTNFPWLVCESDGQVQGYAYASAWKERSAYRKSAEVTIYLDQTKCGRGAGRALYKQLFNDLKNQKMHTLVAGIALPNEASIKIHESFGFEKIAHFREVGFKFRRFIDVGYWQKLL